VTSWSETAYDQQYGDVLQRFLAELRARHVQPIFVVFSHLNARTGEYRSDGFLQRQFADFAASNGVPVLRADAIFRQAAGSADIAPYFHDGCHLSPRGSAALADALAPLVASAVQAAAAPAADDGVVARIAPAAAAASSDESVAR
jgi:hypothetical protein